MEHESACTGVTLLMEQKFCRQCCRLMERGRAKPPVRSLDGPAPVRATGVTMLMEQQRITKPQSVQTRWNISAVSVLRRRWNMKCEPPVTRSA
ncbi:hypothetical protein AVEN_254784-1 [Araneus ventricosus]|uniref:Uncharacterized protein n=1 Tax=Araneus ventricosus TaxID=182803 RepID=A0A4Y2QGU7_ARAVE|nr:hypothetical protein AVEN_254784-1 [Araneus ventricosus]